MNNDQTTEALSIAVQVGAPVILWGAPGTGKTSVIQGLAKALGVTCEVVVASIHDPTDFAGLPVVSNGSVSFAPPAWARRLAKHDSGILFLDELTTAPPAVQAALLRVVLERTVGDLTLPPGTRVVAAANPPDQAADGWDLTPPLANRFCHLEWGVDPSAVVQGLAGGWPVPKCASLPLAWETELVVARAVLAGFLSARPQLVLNVPNAAGAGQAWPSPRSWELAIRLWAAAGAASASPEAASLLVSGCVGTGPALEFLGWVSSVDLPDPEAVLAAPGAFNLPKRADRALAVLSAVVAAVASRPTPERWAAGWEVVAMATQSHLPDVAATAARVLVRCRPAGAQVPATAGVLAPVLKEAGLLRSRT